MKGKYKFLRIHLWIALTGVLVATLRVSSCATTIDKKDFKLKCKPQWKGKSIFVDFDTNANWGDWLAAEDLTSRIRDKLIEDVVEDGCFKVYDGGAGRAGGAYLYKVSVKVASPRIRFRDSAYGRGTGPDRAIENIYATFRIKTYGRNNNLITARSREVEYQAPALTVTIGDSQRELVNNYAHNASQTIRKEFYKSLR